jgi:type II secretory pathway pseudopilin PulG
MVALLVGMSIMAVALSVALPAWSTAARREREAELIFRGQQYARAVALFQRKNANVFPPSWDVLVQGRFLRKKYKDPMTPDGEFQPVYAGQALPGQPGQGGQQGTGGQRGRAGQPGLAGQGGQSAQGGQTPAGGAAQGGSALGGATRLEELGRRTQGPAGRTFSGIAGGGGVAGGIAGATPGLIGVVSKSEETSLRLYNGRDKYNEWVFVATQASTAAGTGARGGRAGQPTNGRGAPFPGPRGGRGSFPPPGMTQPFSSPLGTPRGGTNQP